MAKTYEMPERQPGDGGVSVRRVGAKIRIAATTAGDEQSVLCSEYNAWRIFGMLSMLLGLPLKREVSKAIKLGDGPLEAKLAYPEPTSLGERVAQHLEMQAMANALGRDVQVTPDGTAYLEIGPDDVARLSRPEDDDGEG